MRLNISMIIVSALLVKPMQYFSENGMWKSFGLTIILYMLETYLLFERGIIIDSE